MGEFKSKRNKDNDIAYLTKSLDLLSILHDVFFYENIIYLSDKMRIDWGEWSHVKRFIFVDGSVEEKYLPPLNVVVEVTKTGHKDLVGLLLTLMKDEGARDLVISHLMNTNIFRLPVTEVSSPLVSDLDFCHRFVALKGSQLIYIPEFKKWYSFNLCSGWIEAESNEPYSSIYEISKTSMYIDSAYLDEVNQYRKSLRSATRINAVKAMIRDLQSVRLSTFIANRNIRFLDEVLTPNKIRYIENGDLFLASGATSRLTADESTASHMSSLVGGDSRLGAFFKEFGAIIRDSLTCVNPKIFSIYNLQCPKLAALIDLLVAQMGSYGRNFNNEIEEISAIKDYYDYILNRVVYFNADTAIIKDDVLFTLTGQKSCFVRGIGHIKLRNNLLVTMQNKVNSDLFCSPALSSLEVVGINSEGVFLEHLPSKDKVRDLLGWLMQYSAS